MPRDIKAGRAFVELFADKKRLDRDLRAAEFTVRRFGNNIRALGLGLAGVGAAAATAIIPAISVFAGFEETMSAVRAVTGATGEDFEKLTEKARELGATTSFSAKEAAQGMRFLGMAGFDTQQILAGIPAVLNLAKAGMVELGIAADIASDVSSAFELTAEEIERVADVMAKAAASANVSIEGLGQSFKFAAPAGRAAGQSIEEVASALGTLGSSGLKGSIAGRNIQILFKQLAQSAVQQKLAAMNVQVADAQGNFRDLSAIMKDLQEPLSRLTEVERVRFLTEAFGESAKAAQILASQADGFLDLREKLDNAAGAAEEMAAIMSNNLMGDFREFISAVQETAIAFSSQLEPSLRKAMRQVILAVRSLGEFIKENQNLVIAATAAAVAITGIGTALFGIGTAVTLTASAIGGLKTLIGIASFVMGIFTKSTTATTYATDLYVISAGSAAFATAAWAKSLDSATAALGRLELAITGAAGGTATSMTIFSGAGNRIARLGSNVAVAGSRFAGLGSIIAGAARSVVAFLGPIGATIAAVAAVSFGLAKLQQHFKVFDPLIDAAKEIAGKIRDELFPVLSTLRNTIVNELKPVFLELASAVGNAFTDLASTARPVVDFFKDFISVIGSGLLEQFIDGIKMAAKVLQTVLGAAIKVVKFELEVLLGSFQLAIESAEKLGIVSSREERERGARLDRQLREIQARRSGVAKIGQENSTEKEPRPLPKQSVEGELNPQPGEIAAEVMDSLKSFADSVKSSIKTPQEAFDEYMRTLRAAFEAGELTAEEFRRGAELQRQKFQEVQARIREERSDRLEEISDRNRAAMRDEIQDRVDLARANGDFIGEVKSLARGAAQARQAGFNGLAEELGQRSLLELTERFSSLQDEYQESLESADFQTSSALEAVTGIGQKTVDEQALEESKAIRVAMDDMKSFLQEIRDAVEE